MLRTLIDFCVRQPVLSLLGAFVVAAIGGFCAMVVPIDAIPNVGENQVIVFTEWPGRSPKDVEDQVTYPLSVALLTVPHAENVRGKVRRPPCRPWPATRSDGRSGPRRRS